jgi:hypothetical protein
LYALHFLPMHAASRPPWLHNSNHMWQCKSYEAPLYAVFYSLLFFNPSWVHIFPSAPCSKTSSSLCSSLKVKHQVSKHYCKISPKATVLS